jgi:hypothetical protein
MKDRVAHLRKKTRFAVELRYPIAPGFLDRRGRVVSAVYPEVKKLPHWQVTDEQVVFLSAAKEPSLQFAIGLKRCLIVEEDPDSLQAFLDWMDKYMGFIHQSMGELIPKIDRLGVRFMEVVSTPKLTYEKARQTCLQEFHKTPVDLPLDYKDSQAILVHKYGRYAIGPTKAGDEWLSSVFQDAKKNVPEVGYAIDIDSFATDVSIGSKNDLVTAARSVAGLTLAVEEALFRGAKILDE